MSAGKKVEEILRISLHIIFAFSLAVFPLAVPPRTVCAGRTTTLAIFLQSLLITCFIFSLIKNIFLLFLHIDCDIIIEKP